MDFLSQTHINFEQFNLLELLTRFSLSLILALVAGGVYSFNRGWSIRGASIVYGGVGLSLVITMILLVLSANLFYALGLFAALSIIRFRTPVKDVHDTTHLFLCIGIGIAIGAGALKTATFGTLFILFVQSLYFFLKLDTSDSLILVKVLTEKNFSQKDQLKSGLLAISRRLEITQVFSRPNGQTELIFHIRPRKNQSSDNFVDVARKIDGVEEVLVFPAQLSLGR